ncbi:MAG: hypothetical protein KAV40_05650 [Thermoplasmatales archaeon]|nr:hypothetical protein [Thermoplasmatales archaeon]
MFEKQDYHKFLYIIGTKEYEEDCRCIDDGIQYADEEPPYEWELYASSGLHTIETLAYNEKNTSKDIMDVYFI